MQNNNNNENEKNNNKTEQDCLDAHRRGRYMKEKTREGVLS